jgi:soluble lytic murein transglycosylase
MDPPSDPNPNPGSYSVKVSDSGTHTLVIEEIAPDKDAEAAESKASSIKLKRAQLLGLALLMVALVGAATWWAVSQPGGPASSPVAPSDLPKDAVALINSSTPITLSVPTGAKEITATLSDPPLSEAWTPALREARRALVEGRYTSAISQYSALVGSGGIAEAHAALWGLAETYAASSQRDLAIRAYTLYAGLDDPLALTALYRVALLYEQTGRDADAARLYGQYAEHGGPARHAALLSQARLLGRTPEAEDLYNAVIAENPLDVDLRLALSALAEVKSLRGDHKGAAEVYARLAALQASGPRPILDQVGVPPAVRAADEAAQANDKEGARKRLLDYIKDPCAGKVSPCPAYPFGRYQALTSLLKIDPSAVVSGTISPMLAARIAYDAGYYGPAITHMETVRAISQDPAERATASLLTGKAFELSGDSSAAYNWYTATVQTYPTDVLAPEAARKAGDMLEVQSQWDTAMLIYLDALHHYPNAGRETALIRTHSGVLAYRLDRRDDALTLLRPVLAMQPLSPTLKAEAAFWTAKVEKSKGDPAWKNTIAPVSTLVPGTLLDFRTRSLLAGEPEGGPLTPTFAESGITLSNLGTPFSNESQEREELIAWASTLSSPSTPVTPTITPSRQLTTTLTPKSEIRNPKSEIDRALALTKLGDGRASTALRALADSMSGAKDAKALADLVSYARYHADPLTAMRVAQELASIDATGDPFKRPKLLLKTIYPTPYSELVAQEAETRNIDPLVMYALMRQESQFIPGARSRSDARGLAQVIPSTGEGIAQQLGDPSFSTDDLFLPHVSVRYGTYYLASNLPEFDRKLLPALAAYNGGPGNAARWLSGSALVDPDLYAERIDIFETEDYLGKVYTNYGFYKLAYGR